MNNYKLCTLDRLKNKYINYTLYLKYIIDINKNYVCMENYEYKLIIRGILPPNNRRPHLLKGTVIDKDFIIRSEVDIIFNQGILLTFFRTKVNNNKPEALIQFINDYDLNKIEVTVNGFIVLSE